MEDKVPAEMEDIVIEGLQSKAVLTWYFSVNNFKNAQLPGVWQILSFNNCRSAKLFIFPLGSQWISKMYKQIETIVCHLELKRYLARQ